MLVEGRVQDKVAEPAKAGMLLKINDRAAMIINRQNVSLLFTVSNIEQNKCLKSYALKH